MNKGKTVDGWCFPEKGDVIVRKFQSWELGSSYELYNGSFMEYTVTRVDSAMNGECRIFVEYGTYFYPWQCKFAKEDPPKKGLFKRIFKL